VQGPRLFDCVIPDGVFVRENGGVRFVELAPPSDDEVMAVLGRVVARLERVLRPRLVAAQADARPLDALGASQAEAMLVAGTSPPDRGRAKKRAAYLQGFSLHAAVHLHANDHAGLAHLCGYGARPPFSTANGSSISSASGCDSHDVALGWETDTASASQPSRER
jgi:hypothetical protein